jgi:choloylglycine hydrolase
MCTNLLLSVPNGSTSMQHASARCMELASSMPFSLYLVPQSQNFPLAPPPYSPPGDKTNWASWQNRYGFVAIANPQTPYMFVDGLNEQGLSFGSLWLPGTEYPHVGPHPNLFFGDLGGWILGNFTSVRDIAQRLHELSVVGPDDKQNTYVPLHYIATDATGESLVIEFVNGKLKHYGPDYDHGATSDGVLTNAPTYDWHRTNLANYANLNVVGGATSVSKSAAPVGDGLTGLPGDPMSQSRFVRAATLRKGFGLLQSSGASWLPAPGGEKTGFSDGNQTLINIALQLVQIVMGTTYGMLLSEPASGSSALQVGDWTMWSVVRDHTNRKYYFTTAFNGIMRMVDLTTLNFAAPANQVVPPMFQSIPLLPSSSAWYLDATTSFSAA